MSLHPTFAALVNVPSDPDSLLSVHIGRTWADLEDTLAQDITADGLSREQCRILIEERARFILDNDELAFSVSHLIFSVVPLAGDATEVDIAIEIAGKWLYELAQDDTFERIVALKATMRRILAELGETEGREAVLSMENAELDEIVDGLTAAQICFDLGGLEILVTLEEDATLLIAEIAPQSDDYRVVCVFDHGGDDRDDGDDDPEPIPHDNPDLISA